MDAAHEVYPKNTDTRQECIPCVIKLQSCSLCSLDRRCRKHIPATADTKVKILICENRDDKAVIYTDGLVVHGNRCVCAFKVNVKTIKEAAVFLLHEHTASQSQLGQKL